MKNAFRGTSEVIFMVNEKLRPNTEDFFPDINGNKSDAWMKTQNIVGMSRNSEKWKL